MKIVDITGFIPVALGACIVILGLMVIYAGLSIAFGWND